MKFTNTSTTLASTSIAQFAEIKDRVVIVNGVSKAYAMRDGVLVSLPDQNGL